MVLTWSLVDSHHTGYCLLRLHRAGLASGGAVLAGVSEAPRGAVPAEVLWPAHGPYRWVCAAEIWVSKIWHWMSKLTIATPLIVTTPQIRGNRIMLSLYVAVVCTLLACCLNFSFALAGWELSTVRLDFWEPALPTSRHYWTLVGTVLEV